MTKVNGSSPRTLKKQTREKGEVHFYLHELCKYLSFHRLLKGSIMVYLVAKYFSEHFVITSQPFQPMMVVS